MDPFDWVAAAVTVFLTGSAAAKIIAAMHPGPPKPPQGVDGFATCPGCGKILPKKRFT